MPIVTPKEANLVVGRAAAEAFVKEAKQSPIGEIHEEYKAFLSTLSGGAQTEFDSFVLKNAPDVASLLQLSSKVEQQTYEAKSGAIWSKHFAQEAPNKAIFTAIFGPEILAGRERHQMGANMSKGPNNEVVVDLTVWKPADRQPALGFMTEGLGSAKISFNDDGTYKVLEKT